MLVDWHSFLVDWLTDSISLYGKTWLISGPFRPGVPDTIERCRDDIPDPRLLQTGLRASTLGSLITLRVYYQWLHIAKADGIARCYRTASQYNERTDALEYAYSFPGVDRRDFGFVIELQLGFMLRKTASKRSPRRRSLGRGGSSL